jgi:hypothetical protein
MGCFSTPLVQAQGALSSVLRDQFAESVGGSRLRPRQALCSLVQLSSTDEDDSVRCFGAAGDRPNLMTEEKEAII